MSIKKMVFSGLVSGCAASMLLGGCIRKEGQLMPQVDIWSVDTTICLKEGMKTPSCKIYMELAYLQPMEESDSVSALINSVVQREAFGPKYAKVSTADFGKTLLADYAKNYHTDVKSLFEADLHNGMKGADIPQWYNYEYEITSNLEIGKDSVWNYSITQFSYTGGAHPNTVKRMFNMDVATGKIITPEKAFRMEHQAEIKKLIFKKLISEVNLKMETDTIVSMEDLNDVGILLDGPLSIPENFLLTKNGVVFYYNRYEIAPYSAGDFSLTVPYEEIEAYLKK